MYIYIYIYVCLSLSRYTPMYLSMDVTPHAYTCFLSLDIGFSVCIFPAHFSQTGHEFQEEFCRDLFYAANTFDEDLSKLGVTSPGSGTAEKPLGATNGDLK